MNKPWQHVSDFEKHFKKGSIYTGPLAGRYYPYRLIQQSINDVRIVIAYPAAPLSFYFFKIFLYILIGLAVFLIYQYGLKFYGIIIEKNFKPRRVWLEEGLEKAIEINNETLKVAREGQGLAHELKEQEAKKYDLIAYRLNQLHQNLSSGIKIKGKIPAEHKESIQEEQVADNTEAEKNENEVIESAEEMAISGISDETPELQNIEDNVEKLIVSEEIIAEIPEAFLAETPDLEILEADDELHDSGNPLPGTDEVSEDIEQPSLEVVKVGLKEQVLYQEQEPVEEQVTDVPVPVEETSSYEEINLDKLQDELSYDPETESDIPGTSDSGSAIYNLYSASVLDEPETLNKEHALR